MHGVATLQGSWLLVANRKPSQAIRDRIAGNLKWFRKIRGLTQEELANRCGMVKNYISNVEQGNVNICLANLETIAKGLDAEAWELVTKEYEHLWDDESGSHEDEGDK